jgi:hypothetical protein
MTKLIIEITKLDALTNFAQRIPNADKMLVDWGRDSLFVQIGQYGKDFSIKDILEKAKNEAKRLGIELSFKE